MRDLGGEACPLDLSRRRQPVSHREELVRRILYHTPIALVAGVHTCPKQTRVYLRHQVVVVRPRFYPVRVALGPLDLPIERHLHPRNQLTHTNPHIVSSGRHSAGGISSADSSSRTLAQRLSYSSWRRNQMPERRAARYRLLPGPKA